MSTETEDAVDMDIDYDAEVPCAVDDPACEAPAAWVVVSGCCGLTTLYCAPHRGEVIAALYLYKLMFGGFKCVRCRAHNPTTTWRAL